MSWQIKFVLVTGATGFVGAHVVDEFLRRGIRVRAAARSKAKAEQLLRDRAHYPGNLLEIAYVNDLSEPGGFDEAVRGVDAIVHCASPVTFGTGRDIEAEYILPVIDGAKSIYAAARKTPSVQRLLFTSSFAAVINPFRASFPDDFVYTSEDWNPITYEQARTGDERAGYRGGKKYAERWLWETIRADKEEAEQHGGQQHQFDLVVICPPMVFGPVVHPLPGGLADLNDSNLQLWRAVNSGAAGTWQPAPIWVDVRDLARAHVEAVVRQEAGGRRFLVCAPEGYSGQRVADITREAFEWVREGVPPTGAEGTPVPPAPRGDGSVAAKMLGITYTDLVTTVKDVMAQLREMQLREQNA